MTANTIKLIAILAMTLDHAAWFLFPGYARAPLPLVMHLIGRITCPIMCYFVAEGYHHTRNVKRYTARLLIFALLSHFASFFAFRRVEGLHSFLPFADGNLLNQTSVMWPLACGLLMLRAVNSERIRSERQKEALVLLLCVLSLPGDWSCIASLCVLAIGTNRGNFRSQMRWMLLYVGMYALVYMLTLDPLYGFLQMGVALSIPILKQYNGQRGRGRRTNAFMKWLFYLYYPLHLFIIGLIGGNVL